MGAFYSKEVDSRQSKVERGPGSKAWRLNAGAAYDAAPAVKFI